MDEELRRALDRAAGDDPEADYTQEVWTRGRLVRRRRYVAQTVGGVVGAAVLAGAVWVGTVLLSQPEALPGPALPTVDDLAVSTGPMTTTATPTDQEPTTDRATEETSDEATEHTDGRAEESPAPEDVTTPETASSAPSSPSPSGTDGAGPTEDDPAPEPSDEPPTSEPPTSEEPSPDPSVAIEPCVTPYPDPVLTGDGLPEAALVKGSGVLGAAAECSLETLVEMAGQDGTVLSFGGRSPEEVFAVEQGGERARAITILMTRFQPERVEEADLYRWPAEIDTEEEWQLVVDSGLYSQEDVDLMRRFDGYVGWRVGITSSGRWEFMTAGD